MEPIRWILICAALTLALAPGSSEASPKGEPAHFLFLSASDTSPAEQTADSWVGERTLYLWAVSNLAQSDEFTFGLAGSLELVTLTPLNGAVNLGTKEAPYIKLPSCLEQTFLMAEIVVRDVAGTGGDMCFVPSPSDGLNCVHPCFEVHYWWAHGFIGFSSTGGIPCGGRSDDLCYTVSIGQTSWGKIRSLYR